MDVSNAIENRRVIAPSFAPAEGRFNWFPFCAANGVGSWFMRPGPIILAFFSPLVLSSFLSTFAGGDRMRLRAYDYSFFAPEGLNLTPINPIIPEGGRLCLAGHAPLHLLGPIVSKHRLGRGRGGTKKPRLSSNYPSTTFSNL